MGLTVTNTNTTNLLNIVNATRARQANILTQLSTGFKINKGSDNPAGLIAMKSLEAELTAVNAAIDNDQRSDAMLGVADNAMNEISSLLGEVESLIVASSSEAGMTAAERAANQAQIDQALDSIDRIVRTTNFNGKRLIDGTQAIVTTGIDTTDIDSVRVYSRGSQTSDTTLNVTVTTAATKASGAVMTGFTGTLNGDLDLEITGVLGSKTIFVASGSNEAAVATAINAATADTGVVADTSTADLVLKSSGYGSDDYVAASVISGGAITGAGTLSPVSKTFGADAVVTINGQRTSVDGLDVHYNSNGISVSFSMKEAFNVATSTTSFVVSHDKGGATFQLGTDTSTRQTIGIDSLAVHKLGGGDSGGFVSQLRSGGTYDLNGDLGTALSIVKKGMLDVANAQGRVGAFQKFQVQTSIRTLNAAKISLSEAKSVIADTDFAVATAQLNRESVLLSSGISLLGLANQQTSQILSLLG